MKPSDSIDPLPSRSAAGLPGGCFFFFFFDPFLVDGWNWGMMGLKKSWKQVKHKTVADFFKKWQIFVVFL